MTFQHRCWTLWILTPEHRQEGFSRNRWQMERSFDSEALEDKARDNAFKAWKFKGSKGVFSWNPSRERLNGFVETCKLKAQRALNRKLSNGYESGVTVELREGSCSP